MQWGEFILAELFESFVMLEAFVRLSKGHNLRKPSCPDDLSGPFLITPIYSDDKQIVGDLSIVASPNSENFSGGVHEPLVALSFTARRK